MRRASWRTQPCSELRSLELQRLTAAYHSTICDVRICAHRATGAFRKYLQLTDRRFERISKNNWGRVAEVEKMPLTCNKGAEDGIRSRDPHLGEVFEFVSGIRTSPLPWCSVHWISTVSTEFTPVGERSTIWSIPRSLKSGLSLLCRFAWPLHA